MSELTNKRLEEFVRGELIALPLDGKEMARELLAPRRGVESQEKLVKIVQSMCLANDMSTEPVEKWRFGWNLPAILEQASRFPDDEETIDTFTDGEESEVEALVIQHDCRDLHGFLNEVFDDGEGMGIVTPLRRDAGDDEVARLSEEYQLGETELHRMQTYKKLEGVVESLRQQLREAREEIERLKSRKIECCTCGHEMAEVDGQFGCEHCDHEYDGTCECWQCHHSREHESMQSQITTLTAEREEVVGLLKWIKSKLTRDRLDDLKFIDPGKFCRIIEIVDGK